MYERMTDNARKVMKLANQEAVNFNQGYIGSEHILLGLIKEGTGIAASVLSGLGVDLRRIYIEIMRIVSSPPSGFVIFMGTLPQSPRIKSAVEYAEDEMRRFNHTYIATEHLLLGLMLETGSVAAKILSCCGLELPFVRDAVKQVLGFRDAQGLNAAKEFRVRVELCRILLQFDESINVLDTAVFEAACHSDESLDAQRDRAMSESFQPPVKSQRDEVMVWRNRTARMLGFCERRPNDFTPRDYDASPTGYLMLKSE